METNEPQISQPPKAPQTPVVAQQALNELLDYYQQLANYHRSSVNYYQQMLDRHSLEVEQVEKQLASIEAILNPLTENGAVERKIDLSEAETADSSDEAQPSIAAEMAVEVDDNGKEIANTEVLRDEETKENASKDLASNDTPTELVETQSQAKSAKSKSSESRSSTSRGKKKRGKAKKSAKSFSTRLPHSALLEPYETIGDAVAACLQEHYPHVMSADEILEYYYPAGLSKEIKKNAYGAISNALSKGAGKKGWIKESIGKYRWQEGI